MKKFLNVFLKNHKGVSMVEVLVTVAMLAIVVVPCLSSFVMAQRGNAKAAETQAAYTAAANLMEELKGEPSEVPKLFETSAIIYVKEHNLTAVRQQTPSESGYYIVTIYAGNWTEEGQSLPDEYLIKGVIAP